MENLIKDDYLIIRENSNLNNDPVTPYLLVAKSQIETIAVSDTYDRFGQEITRGDAGDSMTLNTLKAVDVANDEWNDFFSNEEGHEYTEYFELGDNISAYDYCDEYDAVVTKCESDKDYTLYQETSKGFNYWDGNNWKTVTIQVEHGEASHEVVDNEIVEIISIEFATKEFVEDVKGYQRYVSQNGWEFVHSKWSGDFESCTVYSPEMQEYRN